MTRPNLHTQSKDGETKLMLFSFIKFQFYFLYECHQKHNKALNYFLRRNTLSSIYFTHTLGILIRV